jgi:hypothetical protein
MEPTLITNRTKRFRTNIRSFRDIETEAGFEDKREQAFSTRKHECNAKLEERYVDILRRRRPRNVNSTIPGVCPDRYDADTTHTYGFSIEEYNE